jgi:hypothetical protein
MVLIKHFHSTSIWKAFILNAMAASLTIFIAITVKSYLDKYDIEKEGDTSGLTIYKSIVTLLVTFFTALLSYFIMYLLFGFGGGMLSLS